MTHRVRQVSRPALGLTVAVVDGVGALAGAAQRDHDPVALLDRRGTEFDLGDARLFLGGRDGQHRRRDENENERSSSSHTYLLRSSWQPVASQDRLHFTASSVPATDNTEQHRKGKNTETEETADRR